LDERRWVPYYLPQWSGSERSAASYEVGGGRLRLQIEADQEPWCPELDGEVRVSSLQTGVFSGPVGSRVGQHRFDAEAVVREEQETRAVQLLPGDVLETLDRYYSSLEVLRTLLRSYERGRLAVYTAFSATTATLMWIVAIAGYLGITWAEHLLVDTLRLLERVRRGSDESEFGVKRHLEER
jgi:hypothetical protein